MPVSYFVQYAGQCRDPKRFQDHYAGHHASFLKELPGLQSISLFQPVSWLDPFPVNKGANFFMAQITFPDIETLNKALHSEPRVRARDDFENFPEFDGTVSHQAMALLEPI